MNLKLIVPAGICIALCSALEGRLMAQDVPEAGQIGQQTKEAADDSLKLIQQELAGGGDAVTFGELLSGQAGIQAVESGSAGAAPLLMIRGVNSINLYAQPYIYVDGIPVRYNSAMDPFLSVLQPTRFAYVNPNDISGITISRSGEGLSRMGGRGGAGAVYITTERGEFGGTHVDFSASHGWLSADYSVPHMGSSAFRDYLRSYMSENGVPDSELNTSPLFNSSLPQYNSNTDWLSLISRDASFDDYHVKLKGGDADANYMFSIGYTGKQETLKGSGLERISMRFNLDYKLSPKFEISNNLSYGNTTLNYHEEGPDWGIHPLFVSATKAPFFHSMAHDPEGAQTRSLAAVDELGKSNPLALVNSMNNNNEENRVDGLVTAKWTLSPELSLNTSLAVNYYNIKEKQYRPSLGIVNDLHRLRQNSKRNSSELMFRSNSWVEKSGKWGAGNSFSARAGFLVETYEEKSVFARKINAGTDDYETLEQGTVDSASGVKYESNLLAFYLRGEVDLLERVHISANVNLEASSNFGPESRWMVYPGVTAIGDLLDRDQMHQVSLRAEWGRSGNNDLRGYYYKSLYYPANYFGYGGVYLGNVANPDIRPEVTDTYDAGITAALFDGRVTVDAGYYYKNTSDLITYKAVPIEIGLDPQFENNGEVASQGIEISLDARILEKEDVSWNIYGHVSTLKNEIKTLENGDIVRSLGGVSGIARKGEALGSFYGYKVLGVFGSAAEVDLSKADGTAYKPGDYIVEDVNGDSKINEMDQQVIGSALPDLFGSVGTVLQYRRLSLNAMFSFSSGNEIYNSLNQQMHLMKDYSNQSPDVTGRWISESQAGTGWSRAALDDPSSNGAASDLWVEDGSYVKLRRVTLSYEVPVQRSLRFLSGLQLYVTGENLLTFTDYSGMDPEVIGSFDPLLRGIDFGASPMPRSFLVGLKASF
ncbi:MAG TPA: SusC/RagA family TonB-linked outer membrane protein [Anseongella sp.]